MGDSRQHQEIMEEVITWAGDSQSKWSILLGVVKRKYTPTLPFSLTPLTPREILLDWVGNRYDYSRGLANGSSADISFYSRVVSHLEKSVPMALSLDPVMENVFVLKIRASKKEEAVK
jgi:hypothetical protein